VGDEFRFGESLTQEFAYEGLLLRDRRRLHERIGDQLERSRGDSDPAHAALVAHHLSRGQDRERGVRALMISWSAPEATPTRLTPPSSPTTSHGARIASGASAR
jgi:hypothetical protein